MNQTFRPGPAVRGTLTPPPDKSLSHRAALLGAMSSVPVSVTNYLQAADTQSTLDAVVALGADVRHGARRGDFVLHGPGLRGARPGAAIDVGNAGTLLRLLPGWLAGQPEGGSWALDGDESIRRRPVDRVAGPLAAMGAQLDAREGRFTPLTIISRPLRGIEYVLPVASAQIKSCVLLAGLLAEGETTVVEPEPSRDHTERLLAAAGAGVRREGDRITVAPPARAAPRRRSTSPGTRRRPPSTPPRPRSSPAPRCAWRGWRATGPGSASSASSSGWGRRCAARASRRAPPRRPTPSRWPRSRWSTARCAARG